MRLFSVLFILITSMLGLAQVFIPFSFWNGASATLVISDANTYNYGSINISTATDKTFTVSNTGAATATSMSGGAFTNPTIYSFKGGSYPGTGGTCSTSLVTLGSCTIVVTANNSSTGVVADAVKINYVGKSSQIATRAITATFVNAATQLAWITTPSFIKINDCQAVTVQRQDSAGNPITTGSATAITGLLFNNGVTGTYYSNSGCTTTITTSSILAATNSITIYFKNTTSGQTGILVATAAGLTSASQNVTITTAPTKLFLNPSPTMKTATCTSVPINSVDANNYNSNVTTTVTVNLTTTGANIFYSDSGCTAVITSTTILASTYTRTVYTQNATIQTATLTATDNAAALTASSKAVNFNTSLTWWNASWPNRIRIDINNSDQATAFTNQPVLIKIDSTIVNYSNIQANGADIRFVASDDTTALNYEFDKWNSGGTSEMWVRVPSITASSSAGYIYMYFNNPAAIDAQNRTGVWTNYWSVWHLGEDPTATAPQYSDVTGNGRNGTATNSPVRGIGQIGSAADFTTSTTDYIQTATNLSALSSGDFTFSAWMRTGQAGGGNPWTSPGLTGIEVGGLSTDLFVGWIDSAGLINITAGNTPHAKSNFIVNNNAWRHVTMTRNYTTGAAAFYINGILNGSATTFIPTSITGFNRLGDMINATNYSGLLDEVRIFNSVQTAAQIQADFKFMMNTNVIYNSTETGP